VIAIAQVLEFRNVKDLNNYFEDNLMLNRWEVIPIARMFEVNGKMTSCMTYILVIN